LLSFVSFFIADICAKICSAKSNNFSCARIVNKGLIDVFFLIQSTLVFALTILLVDAVYWIVFFLENAALEESTEMDERRNLYLLFEFGYFLSFLRNVGI